MLYILGIGAAAPGAVVDGSLLTALNPAAKQGFIKERRTIVAIDALKKTGGRSTKENLLSSETSPTDLCHEAALEALARAGVQKEQLALIVGDCTTPVQICPSEAQRLGGRLGLKLPAYDMSGASGGFLIHLDTIRKWKAEKTPEYTLCITSNTPTHAIDYTEGDAGYYIGDGAAAYLLSKKHKGKLKVTDSDYTINTRLSSQFRIELQGHLLLPPHYVDEQIVPGVKETLEKIKSLYGSSLSKSFFIGPQFDERVSRELAVSAGFSPSNILSNGERRGDCLGASAPTILGEAWDSVKSGQLIFVVQAGIGLSHGYVVLEGV